MSEQVDPTTSAGPRGPSGAPARHDRTSTAGGAGDLTGWVHFGAVMMTIIGVFGVIEGVAALLRPTTYIAVNGTVLSIDLAAWGWLHLILGALLAVTGVSLLREAPSWARSLGTVLVALSILVQMAWLPAYPLWSIVVIVLDVVVICALVLTWGDR
ncbi:MAG: hypothetical protein K0S40_108 [Actinomycetospora sp.]|jgi:hypothetical protein|nr:hypothetical protein [Actinomycetospora sp.]